MNEGKELQLVTFETTPAKSIVAKLHREIDRIQTVSDLEGVSDHVENAFWTAWHLHAWIWDAIKDQPTLRTTVIKYRGLEEDNFADAMSFGTALARRFVPLKICRKIALGSHHVRVIRAEAGEPGEAIEGSGSTRGARHPMAGTPMVIVMGRPVSVIQLLREVEDYWITLIHENGVEQLR